MDILNIAIAFVLVILFPLGQVFRIPLGNGIAIDPLDIGTFAVALFSFYRVIRQKVIPSFILPLGIFVFVGLLGLLLQGKLLSFPEFGTSILYLFRFVCYAGVGVGVFFLNKIQKEKLLRILLISGGIVVAAGYIQYFFYQSLWGVLYEGWDPHLYRMFSTFLDPNFSGVFFALYFLLILHMWFLKKRMKEKILFGIAGVAVFLAVVLSFSRGSYIDLAVGVVVYLFFQGYKKIALAIPIVIIVLSLLFAYFLPYGEEKHLLRTASTQARLVSAENALTVFEKNPLIGVGFNSYRYAQHRYRLLSGFNWEDTHSGAGANNSYVFVLATTGIFGGIAYGYFLFVILKISYKAVLKKKSFSLFLFSSWIALLMSGIFENTLFYPSIMVWMFVLVGYTADSYW